MAIRDAILATLPSIYYPLSETSGTTVTNQGSQANNGTISGSVTLGQPGPEVNTTAMRLFSGGQIISGPMDLTTFVPQSLGAMISCNAQGTTGVYYPIVNIGDPSNRLSRGPALYENHSALGTPRYGAWWQGGISPVGAVNYPNTFWHWVVITFASGTNGVTFYLDGTVVQQSTIPSPATLQFADPLLIRCDEPCMVAHVCWWGGVLTQTQVQSVSNQLGTWPYAQPINTPPPTPSGGGLTPAQDATLSEIAGDTDTLLGNWSNYTSVTLPSLQDMLNHLSAQSTAIQNTLNDLGSGILQSISDGVNAVKTTVDAILGGITSTITNAAGAVQATVGQLLSQHSHDQFGLYNLTGGPTCEPIDMDVSMQLQYGLLVELTTIPDAYVPHTPDQDWRYPTLAVVVFTRGDLEIARYPIHGTTTMIEPLPEILPASVAGVGVALTPTDYFIHVRWAEGVCGQLLSKYVIE